MEIGHNWIPYLSDIFELLVSWKFTNKNYTITITKIGGVCLLFRNVKTTRPILLAFCTNVV